MSWYILVVNVFKLLVIAVLSRKTKRCVVFLHKYLYLLIAVIRVPKCEFTNLFQVLFHSLRIKFFQCGKVML